MFHPTRIGKHYNRNIIAYFLDTKNWWNDGTVEDKYIEDINYNEMPFAWTQYFPSIPKGGISDRQEYCSLGYKSLVRTEIRIFKDTTAKHFEHAAGK